MVYALSGIHNLTLDNDGQFSTRLNSKSPDHSYLFDEPRYLVLGIALSVEWVLLNIFALMLHRVVHFSTKHTVTQRAPAGGQHFRTTFECLYAGQD